MLCESMLVLLNWFGNTNKQPPNPKNILKNSRCFTDIFERFRIFFFCFERSFLLEISFKKKVLKCPKSKWNILFDPRKFFLTSWFAKHFIFGSTQLFPLLPPTWYGITRELKKIGYSPSFNPSGRHFMWKLLMDNTSPRSVKTSIVGKLKCEKCVGLGREAVSQEPQDQMTSNLCHNLYPGSWMGMPIFKSIRFRRWILEKFAECGW